LLTHRQTKKTNKQTNSGKNITSLVEVITTATIMITVSHNGAFNAVVRPTIRVNAQCIKHLIRETAPSNPK